MHSDAAKAKVISIYNHMNTLEQDLWELEDCLSESEVESKTVSKVIGCIRDAEEGVEKLAGSLSLSNGNTIR